MRLPSIEERISPQELNRRYEAVRAAMAKKPYDALLVSGQSMLDKRGHLRYLTNWCQPNYEEYFLFPLKGEGIYFSRYVNRANVQKKLLHLNVQAPGYGLGWNAGDEAAGKFSVTIPPVAVVGKIKELGFKSIGLCGPETMSGEFYVGLIEGLNKADIKFETASRLLSEIRMIKSEEERKWIRASAAAAVFGFEVFKNIVAVGKQEHEVFLEVDHAQQLAGCEQTFYTLASGYEPLQKYRDLAYRIYEPGDLIFYNSEPAGPGGYFSQFARTLIIGEPDKEVMDAYEAVVAAEEAGEKMLKPGNRACDVFNAIKQCADQKGYKIAQHPGHGQGYDMVEPPIISEYDLTELKPGMDIILHPRFQTPSGRKLWIGDGYIVTESGFERTTICSKDLTIISP
jgi:Xaa-Pro aminopeptidase